MSSIAKIVLAVGTLFSAHAFASCGDSALYAVKQRLSKGAGQTQVLEKQAGRKYLVTTNIGTREKKTFLVRFAKDVTCHPGNAKVWQVKAIK